MLNLIEQKHLNFTAKQTRFILYILIVDIRITWK